MSSVAGRSGKPALRKKSGSRGIGRRIAMLLLVLSAGGLLFVGAPLFIVFLVGMVPTVVAFICDRDREKYTAIAICAGNAGGVVPFLLELAQKGSTVSHAASTVTDVFALAVMYGAAAAGWGLVLVVPSFVSVYMNVTTDSRIQRLRKQQTKLVDEWGSTVSRPDRRPDLQSAATAPGKADGKAAGKARAPAKARSAP